MVTDNDPQQETKSPPAKPGRLELILIYVFLLFVAWGAYKFSIWMVQASAP